jgi:hypothetical protein
MLKFCYDAEKPELLDGLPLAILADGRLHTFGKTDRKWVFVANQEQREIFSDYLHLCLAKTPSRSGVGILHGF